MVTGPSFCTQSSILCEVTLPCRWLWGAGDSEKRQASRLHCPAAQLFSYLPLAAQPLPSGPTPRTPSMAHHRVSISQGSRTLTRQSVTLSVWPQLQNNQACNGRTSGARGSASPVLCSSKPVRPRERHPVQTKCRCDFSSRKHLLFSTPAWTQFGVASERMTCLVFNTELRGILRLLGWKLPPWEGRDSAPLPAPGLAQLRFQREHRFVPCNCRQLYVKTNHGRALLKNVATIKFFPPTCLVTSRITEGTSTVLLWPVPSELNCLQRKRSPAYASLSSA